MNSILACATVAQSPTHAIITAESLAALVGLVFVFFAYARHQAAARDPSLREFSHRVLTSFLIGWAAVSAAIPLAVAALAGTGWPSWSVCAPAPIVQCVAWIAIGIIGVATIMSLDTFAHLRERRAGGQPAFVHTVPMSRPYQAGRLAPESSPAPYALHELLRVQPGSADLDQARADAAVWARSGSAGRFLNSR